MDLQTSWIVGFTDGEGCFYVGITAHKEMRLGFQVQPEFSIVQHKIDIQVLHALKQHFGCGKVERNHGDRWMWRVKNHAHLLKIIIPFFEKHSLLTKKNIEFKTFRTIIRKMALKEHLTDIGFAEITVLAENLRVLTPDQKEKKGIAKEKREQIKLVKQADQCNSV